MGENADPNNKVLPFSHQTSSPQRLGGQIFFEGWRGQSEQSSSVWRGYVVPCVLPDPLVGSKCYPSLSHLSRCAKGAQAVEKHTQL